MMAYNSFLTPDGDLLPDGVLQLLMRHLPPKFGHHWAHGGKIMGHNRNLLKKPNIGLKKFTDPWW